MLCSEELNSPSPTYQQRSSLGARIDPAQPFEHLSEEKLKRILEEQIEFNQDDDMLSPAENLNDITPPLILRGISEDFDNPRSEEGATSFDQRDREQDLLSSVTGAENSGSSKVAEVSLQELQQRVDHTPSSYNNCM